LRQRTRFDRIVEVYNDVWLDGDFNTADITEMQIELLRLKLQTRWIGIDLSDDEIRLTWKSFFTAKYPQ
jgi:hypothetical protein